MPHFSAMERAVTLLRDPVCVARMRAERLPNDVSLVLRILAGDVDAEAEAIRATGKAAAQLREAAEFYVTQVLFHSTSDPYRLLGVRSDATRPELRSNLALLLRWLHPDVAGERHRTMAKRVIEAWNELKVVETRQAVDEGLAKRRDRSRRADFSRRLAGGRSSDRRLPRPTTSKPGPRGASGPKRRPKLVILIAGLVAVVGTALYLQTDTFSGGSHIFATFSQSGDPDVGLPLHSRLPDEAAVALVPAEAKARAATDPKSASTVAPSR